jgi:hypothetical protein
MPGRLCCSAPFILRGYAPPTTLGYPSRSEAGIAKGWAGERRGGAADAAAAEGAAGRRHARLREALRDLLVETGFEVVAESGDGAGAVAIAAELEPDIVVIDLRMPMLNGLDATG